MQPIQPVEKPKKSFGRTLLYFALGLVALVVLSSVFGRYLSEEGFGDGREKIALVEISGQIFDSKEIVRQLSKYRRDDDIKAILLRIDSPGGAVAPSQEIYDEVLRVRADNKKIYASMGSLAASGGYYIAVAADRIFANPGTLTGSIGVIMAFGNVIALKPSSTPVSGTTWVIYGPDTSTAYRFFAESGDAGAANALVS